VQYSIFTKKILITIIIIKILKCSSHINEHSLSKNDSKKEPSIKRTLWPWWLNSKILLNRKSICWDEFRNSAQNRDYNNEPCHPMKLYKQKNIHDKKTIKTINAILNNSKMPRLQSLLFQTLIDEIKNNTERDSTLAVLDIRTKNLQQQTSDQINKFKTKKELAELIAESKTFFDETFKEIKKIIIKLKDKSDKPTTPWSTIKTLLEYHDQIYEELTYLEKEFYKK
jgi:hypothetical protein